MAGTRRPGRSSWCDPSEILLVVPALGVLASPPPVRLAERIYVRGVDDARDGDWRLGHDGLLVELPAGSDAVEVR